MHILISVLICGMMLPTRDASFAKIGLCCGDGPAIRHAIERERMVSSGIEDWRRRIGRRGFRCIVENDECSEREIGNGGQRGSLQS